MGLLKNIWRRFRGGPDFSHCAEIIAILEDKQLTLTLPVSNIQTIEPPRPINFPYHQDEWFEAHAEHSRQHHYVHIVTELWNYMPVGLSAMFSELGMLSLRACIKRVPTKKTIDMVNLDTLGRHLIQEYDEFYNSPTFNKKAFSFLGINTRQKYDIEKEIRDAWGKELTEEELQAKIKDRIPPPDYPPLQPYQIKTINGRDWVFYFEQERNVATKDNYYNFPLNDQYYLSIRLRHRVDWSPKYHLWKKHAEEAEQQIMQMVKIEDYQPSKVGENESDSLKLLNRA